MPGSNNNILISHLAPRNFLSFGPKHPGIELRSLNVLIGPNGSGKSNLIEAVNFMRAAPKDFQEVTRKGGGVSEWIWKGGLDEPASVDWTVAYEESFGLQHVVSFRPSGHRFSMVAEKLLQIADKTPHHSYFEFGPNAGNAPVAGALDPNRSVLAQRQDPEYHPETVFLARTYERIRIYRDWAFGRNAIVREPQKPDLRQDILEEDFSNLGLFLSRLKSQFPSAKKAILDSLSDLYEGLSDFNISTGNNTALIYFTEGDFTIPSTRLSDGTLRYLCLLAILHDPTPPPLICIEEPELGLHPDILPKVADLLREASERTQLIVTTHSDILVDALTECPEAVIVCSKENGQTKLERLNAADLAGWLKEYRLGEIWSRGAIGGNRW